MKFVGAYKPDFDVDEVYGHRTRAWIEDQYKYVAHEEGSEEVYHFLQDNQEIINLAGNVPGVLKQMRVSLNRWMDSFEPFDVDREDFRFQPDKSTEEQLRSLGYIHLCAWRTGTRFDSMGSLLPGTHGQEGYLERKRIPGGGFMIENRIKI